MSSEPGDRADDYDRFVNWDKRLAREGPFFRDVFAQAGAQRVADVGAGTAKHAVMFAGWGMDVLAVDPAPDMLATAADNVAGSRERIESAGGSIELLEGAFGQVAELVGEPVDAVTCTGNALPHVEGLGGLRDAVADFAAALRPGGVLVLQLLNHDRLISHKVRSIPPVVRETEEGTWVFLRVLDYEPGALLFDFLTMHRPADGWHTGADWEVGSRRSKHTAIPSAVLVAELEAAGFFEISLFGDHALSPFHAASDESVILTGRKR